MVLGIQILGLLFGIFMMYLTFLHYKRNEFTAKSFGVWTLLWALFIVAALFPDLLDYFVYKGGFIRTLDFFMVLGFMLLIGAVFLNYSLLRKTQRKVEELVRKNALERKK